MEIARNWKDYEILDMANGEKLESFISLFSFFILLIIHSQFIACSGNKPVCLNPIGLILKVESLYLKKHLRTSRYRVRFILRKFVIFK